MTFSQGDKLKFHHNEDNNTGCIVTHEKTNKKVNILRGTSIYENHADGWPKRIFNQWCILNSTIRSFLVTNVEVQKNQTKHLVGVILHFR